MNKLRLTDVCDFQGGSQPPKEQWINKLEDGYIRMLQIRDFTQRKNEEEYVKLSSNLKICDEDDVLIARYGASVGKILTGLSGAYNVAIIKSIPNTSKLLKRYLYYYFNSEYFQNGIKNVGSRAAQAGFNKNDLEDFEIFVSSLEEQQKIIDILDKSQELIEKRKEQIEALDELVKSKFIEMFKEINEYVPISNYIESLTAGKSLAGESECKNKVLNTGSISYDYFDKTQVKNLPNDYLPKSEHLVNKGDVLISRMNTSELVGATAYVWDVDDNIYIPDRLWKANFKENANPIFVWQLLIQNNTKEKIRRIASGTSGSMKNISKAGLLGIEAINVDLKKQNEFADFVRQVDKLKFIVKYKLLIIKHIDLIDYK